MNTETKGLEWKVGLFLLLGLVIISVMAIKFGKVGQGLTKYYKLQVEFANASGLLKDADVFLSGARVGYVHGPPALIKGRYAVRVELRIEADIKVPRGSIFSIKSAGFMGDTAVAIETPLNPDSTNVYADGEQVNGELIPGFGELTAAGGDVMEEMKKRLIELQVTVDKVNSEVLSKKNTENLDAAISNFKVVSEDMKEATKDLDQIVGKGKEVVEGAKVAVGHLDEIFHKADSAMGKIDSAAGEVKTAVAGITKFSETATKTAEGANTLLTKANKGDGVLGMLLGDKETAENFKTLIRNLKERGVLFYKNKEKP